mgnify:CR=1 FL=1
MKWKYVWFGLRLVGLKLRHAGRLRLQSFSLSLERDVELILDGNSSMDFGSRVYVRRGSVLDARNGATLKIGSRVFMNRGCSVVTRAGIEIGEETLIGEYVTIYDHNHTFGNPGAPLRLQGFRSKPVRIGRNVWLGTKVFVGAGVTIGDNAVVGAHTIVTKDIPANSLVYGKSELVIKPLPSAPQETTYGLSEDPAQ